MSVTFLEIIENDTDYYAEKFGIDSSHPKFGVPARVMVFDVDGQKKKVKIPDTFDVTIDELIEDAARGLRIEADNAAVKQLDKPSIKSGTVIA